jgi:ketosteroid isomerase-like protein
MSAADAAKSAIERLEDRRYAAMLAADTAVLEGLLHDDLVYMHSTGGRDTKASYLAALENGTAVYRTVVRDDQTVLVHGDMALVFNRLEADVEIRNKAHRLDNRLLAVWVCDGGIWRLIGLQSGARPPAA